jgi:hypothetical protein
MEAFQLYLKLGKQTKAGWVGDNSLVVFRKKNSLVKKEERDIRYDVTASSFVNRVCSKILEHFDEAAIKVRAVCGIDCLDCQK